LASQFDIVENSNQATRAQYPYLLILQHDRTSSFRVRIAAPLVEWTSDLASSRVHPTVEIDGRRFVALTEHLGAIPQTVLGKIVGPGETQRYEIIAALDLLFTGI
jgi:toxin CcdB